MSKNATKPVKTATISINVAGHWYSREVDSAVLAYACASSYIDSGVDYPGRHEADRIAVKEKIMRACLEIFDGVTLDFSGYGMVVTAKEVQV